MSLDPQITAVLTLVKEAAYPEFWQLSAQQARAQFEKTAPVLNAKPVALHRIENLSIPGPGGNIALRCYTPRHSEQPLPILMWYHGGGFVIGGLDSYDTTCRLLAQQTDCLVVSVDYRLAPEHKFPAAPEDCFAALQWTINNAGSLGGDASRIAVAGDSAGGNLAAVTAILARDNSGPDSPKLCFQLLIYPCTAPTLDSNSCHQFAEGYLLSRQNMLWFYNHYLSTGKDHDDYRFAPLLTRDLSNLPPALVIVAGYDPLYDEGVEYAERLRSAGNQVELADYPGMIHGFYSMAGAVDAAKQAIEQSAQTLQQAFQHA